MADAIIGDIEFLLTFIILEKKGEEGGEQSKTKGCRRVKLWK